MDTFVPLKEAAKVFHYSEENLNALIEVGKIRSAPFTGGKLVSNEDIANLPKELRPEYDHSLVGVRISMGDASRRYHIPHPTISRWVSKGYIKIIEQGRTGQKVMIDEADIKFCAIIYSLSPGQGNRAFTTLMDRITVSKLEG
jgi:hypothetical protein